MGWKALTDTKSLCVDLGRPLKSKPQIIRALHKDDLDDVARLFQKTFRSNAAASPAVKAALSDTFLNHPHADDELTSQVLADETGKVGGFIGIIPVKMVIEGRPVRAACAGSMMVERPSKSAGRCAAAALLPFRPARCIDQRDGERHRAANVAWPRPRPPDCLQPELAAASAARRGGRCNHGERASSR